MIAQKVKKILWSVLGLGVILAISFNPWVNRIWRRGPTWLFVLLLPFLMVLLWGGFVANISIWMTIGEILEIRRTQKKERRIHGSDVSRTVKQ